MKSKKILGVPLLITTAFLWGTAFVIHAIGMENGVGPLTFNCIRTIIGAIMVGVLVLVRKMTSKDSEEVKIQKKKQTKKAWKYGALIGVLFCAACSFQTFALKQDGASAGKVAFITTFYMFLVPIIGLVFKKRTPLITWICVAIGIVGMYFTCVTVKDAGMPINQADLLALVCSVFYALHILVIEKFAPDVDVVELSFVQFVVAAVVGFVLMVVVEKPSAVVLLADKSFVICVVLSGVLSCGVATTFQVIGLKYTEATVASIILCLESVFGILTEAVYNMAFKHTDFPLSAREMTGCAIMFVAIILSQIGEPMINKLKEKKNS